MPEMLAREIPIREQGVGPSGVSFPVVILDMAAAEIRPMVGRQTMDRHRAGVETVHQVALAVVDEGHAARHPGPEIVPDGPQDGDNPTRHILAAVGATAFDHRRRARVPNREPFPGTARRIKRTAVAP